MISSEVENGVIGSNATNLAVCAVIKVNIAPPWPPVVPARVQQIALFGALQIHVRFRTNPAVLLSKNVLWLAMLCALDRNGREEISK